MFTELTDYISTNEFYRIPSPMGGVDEMELLGVISEGERKFADTFGVEPNEENADAVRFFVFAFWLKVQSLKKTAQGASAKVRFNQAENHFDTTRYYYAYNRACELMGAKDKKLVRIINV